MESLKEQYYKLMKDVATNDYYKVDLNNRVNCYVCPKCKHITKTIDKDAGCTPYLHECELCHNLANSCFYNDIAPFNNPTQEWYRPKFYEFKELNEAARDHVLNGGLLSRKIQ